MKTLSEIHLDNFVQYSKMLDRKPRPELKKILEDELERNRDLYLYYSSDDHTPLQAAGLTITVTLEGTIEYRI
jgi:hypothetical protein